MANDISSINEDYKYERAETPVQRIFWILMGAFLFLGLLGFLGDSGILNIKKITTEEYSIEYERFLRIEKSSEITILVNDSANEYELKINRDYLSKNKITEVFPEPIEIKSSNNEIIYKFSIGKEGVIKLFIDPLKNGKQKTELTINGKSEILNQYIYL